MQHLYELKKVNQSSDQKNVIYALEEEKGLIKNTMRNVDGLFERVGFITIQAITGGHYIQTEKVEFSVLLNWVLVLFAYSYCFMSLLFFNMFDSDLSNSVRLESLFWAVVMFVNVELFRVVLGRGWYGFSTTMAFTLVGVSVYG